PSDADDAQADRVRGGLRRAGRRGAGREHARSADGRPSRLHAKLPARAPRRPRRAHGPSHTRAPGDPRRRTGRRDAPRGRGRMTDEARVALEASLGHRFVRPERLAVALTHRSTGDGAHNETLEFLGDAVLSLAVSDLLMRRFPTATEGDLSKRRASLVNAEELAQKARAMDLGRWLSVGKGE